MKTIILLIITSLLAISCKKEAYISTEKGRNTLIDIDARLSKVDVKPWTVGKARDRGISQGISIKIELPEIDEDSMRTLASKHSINGWLVRLQKEKDAVTTTIGEIYVPFYATKSGEAQLLFQSSILYFQVFYAAAYNSSRFRLFHCPAFDHRKEIDSVDLTSKGKTFSIPVGTMPEGLAGDPSPVGIGTTKFNGGHSLKGEYYGELALLNYKTKTLYSDFYRFDGTLTINKELRIDLPECKGIKEELEPVGRKDIRKFKFGRQ